MNKSDKPSHQSIDSRETTRAQQTKLNIYLSLNIYLQDAEHAWIHRYWKSTFLSYTESPRLFQIYEGTSHIWKMRIIWRDGNCSLEIHFIDVKRYKVKKKKKTGSSILFLELLHNEDERLEQIKFGRQMK